jgi:ESS family glutamate:Na+ symporter
LVGGPVATYLIRRFGLSPSRSGADAAKELETELEESSETIVVAVEREDTPFMRNLAVLGLAMGIGSIVSAYIQSLGVTLPAYIGAMLVASVLRNLDDATGWFRIDQRIMEFAGNLALNIFLVVALMTLKLWELAGLALPLFLILVAQVIVVVLFALTVSFRVMGKDYESAVMASGFIGFVLGTTANAVANMRALVARFGAAPRAFLVVPLVGAFFIDFANAIIITFFVNWLK